MPNSPKFDATTKCFSLSLLSVKSFCTAAMQGAAAFSPAS